MSNELQQGTVVLFNKIKLYGFIEPDGVKDADLFFHLDAFDADGDPAVGDRVTFIAAPNLGRPGRQLVKAISRWSDASDTSSGAAG